MDRFLLSLAKLPNGAEMRSWDKAAIDFGIPEKMLMENAGTSVHTVAREKFGSFRHVCLFMGSGNNGGDAACMARHLMDDGATAAVYCTKPLTSLTGSPAWHYELAKNDGAKFFELATTGSLESESFLTRFISDNGFLPDLIVDGLLGTGFEGDLRPDMLALIQMINGFADILNCPVIAIDIPSGLDSRSGAPSPDAIAATVTVTLAAAKPGLFQPVAKPYTGEIVCRSIGLPAAVESLCVSRFRLLNGDCVKFQPVKIPDSYKNIYGHVAVFGGAPGYEGAAHLAAVAALRSGAGLVTVCAPEASLSQIKAGWPEIMTCPATDGPDWTPELKPEIIQLIRKATSLAIGPGMGRSEKAAAFLTAVLELPGRPPAVIDADALFLIAHNPGIMLKSSDVITPHPGEAGELLGITGKEIQKDRPGALDRLCALGPAVTILKGAATVVGHNDLRLLCPYDIPGLAIGGAGDTLSGCVAALLGSGQYKELSPLSRAGLGVAMHAMAGLYLQKLYPERGFTASQLADALACARGFAASQNPPLEGVMPWPA